MDYYLWIKAIHLIAIMILIGGMLMNGFLFRNVTPGTPDADRVLGAAVAFNRAFVGTALGVVWIAGLYLVWDSGFYRDGWFMVKFVLVLALSGIHGAQTGRLNKMRQSPADPVPAFFRNSGHITLALVIFVVCLVAVKPF
ncbi:CopD family protein [Rhizobium sp. TH2]|uniref:CopD family protein n=1 Tax=Rhizobium sp. TH2 TaxID=2775403 RepID=UPI002157F519|nr:CopD family protein [Rhizobium sp. TH2]UVC07266.1 CopD family protein [Rhizobium sp. TH2]